MSIVLIGYRGSGKSTIARQLADLMRWPWADTDDLIVQRAGMTIREIFEQLGEAHFRDLEAAAVADACRLPNRVIALGGGAVLRQPTRELLKRSGDRVIYLHADPQTLHDRIHADPNTQHTRPNLTHLGGGVDEIASLLNQRLPLYREVMTDEIDVARMSPNEVAREIKQRVDKNHPGLAT